MEEKDLTCRYCGRPIAVAMSTCPWPDCRATIMVICAACRAYTDDQGEFCEQCGEPLVAATFEEVELPVGTQALLHQLARDQERALLVASGVLARYSGHFFGDDAPPEGTLANLLGVPLTVQNRAAALLFSAVAYLVQAGYCDLEHEPAPEPRFLWVEKSDWEGQADSLEASMAAQAWQRLPVEEAIRQMIAGETGFRLDDVEPEGSLPGGKQDSPPVPAPSRMSNVLNRLKERLPRRQARTPSLPPRPAATTIIDRGWETVLPEHEETAACEETRQLLSNFEKSDPQCAQYVLDQIHWVLSWFVRAEQDPHTQPGKQAAGLPDPIRDKVLSQDGPEDVSLNDGDDDLAQDKVKDDAGTGDGEETSLPEELGDEPSDDDHE
jgi:hypothetical protein